MGSSMDDDDLFFSAMRELGAAPRRSKKPRPSAKAPAAPEPGDADLAAADAEFLAAMAATFGDPSPEVAPERPDGWVDTPEIQGPSSYADPGLAVADQEFMAAMGALPDDPARAKIEGLEPPPPPQRTRARGTKRALLRRIRSGAVVEERTLDLHGMTKDAAWDALSGFITRARADDLDVVRVISGRGLHSVGEAVLMKAVVGWLRDHLAEHVVEVVKAPRDKGGEGAWYAFLRARR